MIRADEPLEGVNSKVNDKFGRRQFSRTIAETIYSIKTTNSFTVSIEGPWGIGKTSTLNLLKEALVARGLQPKNVVDFNPWLVGDRDALLGSFFLELASSLEVNPHDKQATRVASSIRKYLPILDVGKYIPGAEAPAGIIRLIAQTIIARFAKMDMETEQSLQQSKMQISGSLRELDTPIYVFIDDIDRLYPQEIMEVVRVVKTAGDLPNMRYVLAFDPAYVQESLTSLGVPKAAGYLDKIVQHRHPIPPLSPSAKQKLVNEYYSELPQEVRESYFHNDDEALSTVYNYGVKQLLQLPRDFIRVFNVLDSFSAGLAGEVRVADILGLATMYVKAQPVYELMSLYPQAFVGNLPRDVGIYRNAGEVLEGFAEQRNAAYKCCESPMAAKHLAHALFPQLAQAEDGDPVHQYSRLQSSGAISEPARLLIALQQIASSDDVSFVEVRKYLSFPDTRDEVIGRLTINNCLEFLSSVHDAIDAESIRGDSEAIDIALSVAALPDTFLYVAKTVDSSRDLFAPDPLRLAAKVVHLLMQGRDAYVIREFASRVVSEAKAPSYAAYVLINAVIDELESFNVTHVPEDMLQGLLDEFSKSILELAESAAIYTVHDPLQCIVVVGHTRPEVGRNLLGAIKRHDSNLDSFIKVICAAGADSHKGRFYQRPMGYRADALDNVIDRSELAAIGEKRVDDASVDKAVKAAWAAFIQDRRIYAVDGSCVD